MFISLFLQNKKRGLILIKVGCFLWIEIFIPENKNDQRLNILKNQINGWSQEQLSYHHCNYYVCITSINY